MSYVFVNFQQITFKIGTFSNLKALFLAKLTDFPQLVHDKSGKKTWKGRLHSALHLHLSRSHGDRLGATDLATLSLHLQVYLSSG